MRIGRTGVFVTADGKVGVGAVLAILNDSKVVIKEAVTGTGQLIECVRGEFHIFDSDGLNPHAADLVRDAVQVALGGRETLTAELDGVVPLNQFNITTGTAKPIRGKKAVEPQPEPEIRTVAVSFDETVLKAIQQAVRQGLNKKRIQPVQKITIGKKAVTKNRRVAA